MRGILAFLIGTLMSLWVVGCSDDGSSGTLGNSFGEPTTTAATSASPTSNGGSQGEDSGAASTTGMATTGMAATEGGSSSGGPSTTDVVTTGMPGDSSGAPAGAELGECIGIGAWASCAQYCEAVLDVCVEGGCDGMTVVYYDDVGACTAMEADDGEVIACDQGFAMGGGISFARCCCA